MNTTAPTARWTRDSERAVVAGVLAGLARRIRVDPIIVRVAFVVLVVGTGGLALLGYALAWGLMPAGGAPGVRSWGKDRPGITVRLPGGWRVALGVGLLTLAALLVFRELGFWWSDKLVWPMVLAASGAALLWRLSRQRSEEPGVVVAPTSAREPAPRAGTTTPASQSASLYRGGFGVALVIGAALLFLSANDALGAARDVALATVVALVAVALILAPFLWRLGRNLASERAERIRSQERAELAAHLHDSVLQTLTLMQKHAGDPREVAALARRQERELRGWLFGRSRPATESFAAALEQAASEVEDAHGIPVEVVAVGDAEMDKGSQAMIAATREALTNAAKFAPDAGPVALYAEADGERLQVFVRDRGPGFDPDAVPADRRGVRESIVGRMERHGGHAEIHSGDGEGTEVELTLERNGR